MKPRSLLAGLRRTRVPGAIVVLAFFLLGTNFCLVGMALAAAAPAKVPACHAQAASGSPASHCGGTATGQDSAPSGRAPCCEALAPVTATETPKAPPASVLHLLFHFAAPTAPIAAPNVVAIRLDFAPPADESPPTARARAPLTSRAPPQA